MSITKLTRQIRLNEWSNQIKACEASGLTVTEWCYEKGISIKTYYYRKKRIREEYLDSLDSSEGQVLALAARFDNQLRVREEPPVFATVPMPQSKGAALTVWIGPYAVDIQNGVDGTTVEQVLKVVSRL